MLKNIVTLVTGGASGLGKATVEILIKQGGKVVICDLPSSDGASLAKELGPNTVFCPVDVTSESDVQNSLKVTKDKFDRLDAVVNCAGMFAEQKIYDFDSSSVPSLDIYRKLISVNAIGTYNVIRLAVGLINENKPNDDGSKGVIINTASVMAYDGRPGIAGYSSSKAAVVGMTLPLAREFGRQGIRVCTICPGYFDTPMLQNTVSESARKAALKILPHPKRMGKPDEFGLLVKAIIENPFLNGEVIRIDGGLHM